ncbi:MAG: hypothetical protein WC882_02470 [Candidatus Gracilibacteria bacterium]
MNRSLVYLGAAALSIMATAIPSSFAPVKDSFGKAAESSPVPIAPELRTVTDIVNPHFGMSEPDKPASIIIGSQVYFNIAFSAFMCESFGRDCPPADAPPVRAVFSPRQISALQNNLNFLPEHFPIRCFCD